MERGRSSEQSPRIQRVHPQDRQGIQQPAGDQSGAGGEEKVKERRKGAKAQRHKVKSFSADSN